MASNEKFTRWTTAISITIAAFAISISLLEMWSKQRKNELSQWQRVVVYQIIEKEQGLKFDDIKSKYIVAAQQFESFDIPKKEIQDGALRSILMGLHKDDLVHIASDRRYRPVLAKWQPKEDIMWKMFEHEMKMKELYPKIRVEVVELLNLECGKYNKDQLYRKISGKYDIEFPIFFDMLNSMRGREVNKLSDETWCSTYDINIEEEKEHNNTTAPDRE